jgi:hypothetical protein
MVEHPYRATANRLKNHETGRWEFIPDFGGTGWQIKREIKACDDCKTYSPELATDPQATIRERERATEPLLQIA